MKTEANDLLSFFLSSSLLKSIPRTGWVWEGIENPETIAEHCFRVTFFAWVLGAKANLQQSRLLPMALTHELCEIHAGDMTPYFDILPEDEEEKQKVLQRWVRLSQKKKEILSRKKFDLEKKALDRVLDPLSPLLQERLLSLWMEYEKGSSLEGKFVKQIDRVEALLQGIEYLGPKPDSILVGWWEGTEEIVDHPILRAFLKTIEHRLYENKASDMDGELAFLMEVGKLKRRPRRGWIIRDVQNPETMANHTFSHALMAWILSWEAEIVLNRDRILKMCLLRLLCHSRLEEESPFDNLLRKAKTQEERRYILGKWIRSSSREKRVRNEKRYLEEEKTLRQIIAPLDSLLQEEMLSCKKEYGENKTSEARFTNQAYVLEILLRAFQYAEEDTNFDIKPWWEWASESIDNSVFAKLMNAMDKRFAKT